MTTKTRQAIDHQVGLVSAHTVHIRKEEAKPVWDAQRLSFHYKARHDAIMQSLELGVTAAYLSEITQLG